MERKNMNKFLKTLGNDIEKAIKDDAKRVIKETGKEHIYAVALVLDSDCISVYMAVNTNEYLKTADREYFEMFKEDLPEDEIIKYESGKAIFTKWIPDEWGYSDGDKSKLNKISRKLAKMEEKSPEEYESHKDEIINIIINSFDKVIGSSCFDNESVTFFVSMADDEQGSDLELDSSKKLNSDVLHNIFIKEREESF